MDHKFLPDAIRRCYQWLGIERSLPPLNRDVSITHTSLLLDISGSMNETDVTPSRLAAAKEAAIDLVRQRLASDAGCRFSIISFSDVSLVIYPLSSPVVIEKIESSIRSLTAGGSTLMTSALVTAQKQFEAHSHGVLHRELILLTDGCNSESSDPCIVADRIKAAGCIIHTRGIGGDRKAVDEGLLCRIASRDSYGNPLYKFHTERSALVNDFRTIGRLMR